VKRSSVTTFWIAVRFPLSRCVILARPNMPGDVLDFATWLAACHGLVITIFTLRATMAQATRHGGRVVRMPASPAYNLANVWAVGFNLYTISYVLSAAFDSYRQPRWFAPTAATVLVAPAVRWVAIAGMIAASWGMVWTLHTLGANFHHVGLRENHSVVDSGMSL
jgi:hypothetical protein